MIKQIQIDYSRIEKAIGFMKNNYSTQPSLTEIAAHVNMSDAHFQKVFSEWAGVSPKKILQFVSLSYAKSLLKEKKANLFEATLDTGLSSKSRLHDLFVNIEGMTPAEYKNDGENLTIEYCFSSTNFGSIIIANTTKGICHLAFIDDEKSAVGLLKNKFIKANFIFIKNKMQQDVITFFENKFLPTSPINVHLKGTLFQLKVWECLLHIPFGQLCTYGNIANKINSPKAARAVGTAISDNPIAYLIPCHRVIQATGIFGGYMWGENKKTAIIGWEAARSNF